MAQEHFPETTNGGDDEQAAPSQSSPSQEEHSSAHETTPSDVNAAVVPTNGGSTDRHEEANDPPLGSNIVDHDEGESDDESNEDDDDDEQENTMAALPPYVLQRVEKLKDLNAKRDKIMEQYLIDRAALEAKYHALCEPLYVERASIVNGERDSELARTAAAEGNDEKDHEEQAGTDESDKYGEETKGSDDEEQSKSNEENRVAGIPQFWVCAMSQMEPLAELVTEEDVDCLENLRNIRCRDDVGGTGFTLEFHFAPNDYFYNSVLTKRYEVPNLLLDDEPILKNVEGCKIQWKTGQSLTFRQVIKKQRGTGKNSGLVRTVKKKERRESFFHFFEPPKMPSMEDMDEDEAERLEEAFEEDYDVAQAFRSHIIPKAVMWFTGQALEEEMEQMLNETTGVESDGPNPFSQPAQGERPPECEQS